MQPSNQRADGLSAAGVNIDQEKIQKNLQDHIQNKVIQVGGEDKQVWQMVTNVPYVSKPVAIVSAILNFLIPGLGTTVAACSDNELVSKTQLTVALFQFLTAFFLVGYLLSWYWGYLIVIKSWTN